MYGVVTRNTNELTWAEFDRSFYEVKDVTGRLADPVSTGANMISCFGDSATGEVDPSLVPIDETGTRATREQPYFDWGYICPTSETYQERLLSVIDESLAKNENIRLDDVGFPRAEYCHCDRCRLAFSESEFDDWASWRCSVITSFVEAVSDRVPGRLSLTCYPDPYPGHLVARSGLDLDALTPVIDEIIVPLYDLRYDTTYWLEAIANGFASRLPIPFSIELYAVDVPIDNLVHATTVAETYADNIFFGYDAGNARAVIRRLLAERSAGNSYP